MWGTGRAADEAKVAGGSGDPPPPPPRGVCRLRIPAFASCVPYVPTTALMYVRTLYTFQPRAHRTYRVPYVPCTLWCTTGEAELAQKAAPSTMQLAWHGLADEISRLNPAGETEISRFDRTLDRLGMDSGGRLLKLSERPDRRRKWLPSEPGYHERHGSLGYHERNWVAASLPLHGALTEQAMGEHYPSPSPSPSPSPQP